MLVHRLRRWPNIKTASGEFLVLLGRVVLARCALPPVCAARRESANSHDSRPTKLQITPQVGLSPTDPTSGFWNYRYVNISVKVSHNYHLTVITLSSVGHFWLEKRLSHSIARLFTELSKIDTATSPVITWSAHDTCMLYCWLIMPRNLWVTLENCWMTILHFKVVLAAIFIKININNR